MGSRPPHRVSRRRTSRVPVSRPPFPVPILGSAVNALPPFCSSESSRLSRATIRRGGIMRKFKTVSKATFLWVSWLLFFAFALAGIPLAVRVVRMAGPGCGLAIGGLVPIIHITSRLAADRLFTLLRMSRSGKAVEVRTRSSELPNGVACEDEVVQVHDSTGSGPILWAVTGLTVLLCLGIVILVSIKPQATTKDVVGELLMRYVIRLIVALGLVSKGRIDLKGGCRWSLRTFPRTLAKEVRPMVCSGNLRDPHFL